VLIDSLREAGAPDAKAIIFCHYRHSILQVVAALEAEFGPGCCVTYYGGTSDDDRREAVRSFQDVRGARFFVGNSAAAYGLTLTRASTVVYYANTYNLEIRQQSEDRAHRIGQTKAVTYIDLVSPGTVDEHILKALLTKQSFAKMVADYGAESFA